jgi:26S proteasome regulatory subunit (ATPase 3-interacting protein)
MAPRKKTEEKAAANEAADMVLHYLRVFLTSYTTIEGNVLIDRSISLTSTGKQNRPYSAIDISANLHNKVTKGKFHCDRACSYH